MFKVIKHLTKAYLYPVVIFFFLLRTCHMTLQLTISYLLRQL